MTANLKCSRKYLTLEQKQKVAEELKYKSTKEVAKQFLISQTSVQDFEIKGCYFQGR